MKSKVAFVALVLGGTPLMVSAQKGEPGQALPTSEAKLSRAAAKRIALAKVPSGTIRSAEIEKEKGALVWSFDIATPKSRDIREILVNARTGAIVDMSTESPQAQSEEAAAEKREKGRH